MRSTVLKLRIFSLLATLFMASSAFATKSDPLIESLCAAVMEGARQGRWNEPIPDELIPEKDFPQGDHTSRNGNHRSWMEAGEYDVRRLDQQFAWAMRDFRLDLEKILAKKFPESFKVPARVLRNRDGSIEVSLLSLPSSLNGQKESIIQEIREAHTYLRGFHDQVILVESEFIYPRPNFGIVGQYKFPTKTDGREDVVGRPSFQFTMQEGFAGSPEEILGIATMDEIRKALEDRLLQVLKLRYRYTYVMLDPNFLLWAKARLHSRISI